MNQARKITDSITPGMLLHHPRIPIRIIKKDKRVPIPTAAVNQRRAFVVTDRTDGDAVLAYLMEEHGLRQSDLPEVGSQGVVSEVLSGKRELNVRQIRELAARFGVSPAVFV